MFITQSTYRIHKKKEQEINFRATAAIFAIMVFILVSLNTLHKAVFQSVPSLGQALQDLVLCEMDLSSASNSDSLIVAFCLINYL